VFTPTSELISTSSNSSKTSSSTLDFPATALDSLLKKEVLDCSNPLSKDSFFFEENIFPKIPMNIILRVKLNKKSYSHNESSSMCLIREVNYFFLK
jgi:hypothetical protein